MDKKLVEHVMIPLDEFPVVGEDATLVEALRALDDAQSRLPAGRQPYRAVLVKDRDKRVVGKLGQWAFLMALEPKYAVHEDLERLDRANVDPELVASMMEHYSLFQNSLSDLCQRAAGIRVRDVMRPVENSIGAQAPLTQAIHRMVLAQSLSLLVTRGADVVGLIRLSDVFEAVADYMRDLSAGGRRGKGK